MFSGALGGGPEVGRGARRSAGQPLRDAGGRLRCAAGRHRVRPPEVGALFFFSKLFCKKNIFKNSFH